MSADTKTEAMPPAEPFAYALLTWPAAAAAVQFGPPDALWWRIGALLWLAAFHLAAYGNGRGSAFGNIMLLMSLVVAGACALQPSPWALAALPLLLIGLHAAQRALLRGCVAEGTPEPTAMNSENDSPRHAAGPSQVGEIASCEPFRRDYAGLLKRAQDKSPGRHSRQSPRPGAGSFP